MRGNRGALALFWAVPPLMFFVAETATGNLLRITPAGFLLNLALYYLIYLGAWVLFGTNRGTWPVLNLALYVLAAGNYFVSAFRGSPIMIWDVLALKTAMTVSSNYQFFVTPHLVLTFLAAAVLGILVVLFPVRLRTPETGRSENRSGNRSENQSGNRSRNRSENRSENRLGALCVYAVSCAAFGWLLFGVLLKPLGLEVHMWDPIVNFEKHGFLLSTVLSAKHLFPEKPEGYSRESAEALLAEEGAPKVSSALSPKEAEAAVPLNVICIMNESFADLGIYNGLTGNHSFETDREYLENFHSLTENAEKGFLYVPVFGAITANTEYEFLTGNACGLAPQGSVPFQFYTKPGDDSLARSFGEAGYRTVAMHPYPGYNWNRTKAYENLGFDEFLDLAWYEEQGRRVSREFPRGYMSDRSNYDGIIQVVKEKAPGEKLFLFNVTIQNHGGYEVDGLDSGVRVSALNREACAGEFPKADQYLTLIKMSDEALAGLLEYFRAYEEPTMIVLFGDHQPSLEPGFYEALYGSRWSQVPGELKINSFKTPYLIWTNYDREIAEGRDQSSFMLGNAVLQEAKIPLTGFRRQIENVRQDFRAIHSMGVVDADGRFTDISEMESRDQDEQIRRLRILQYYRMFDE